MQYDDIVVDPMSGQYVDMNGWSMNIYKMLVVEL